MVKLSPTLAEQLLAPTFSTWSTLYVQGQSTISVYYLFPEIGKNHQKFFYCDFDVTPAVFHYLATLTR